MDDALAALGEGPATTRLLGWRLIDVDVAAGSIEVAFEGKPEFGNPAGVVQGGILIAMMDDTAGPIVPLHTRGRLYPSSIDIHAHFLRPVRFGAITVRARILQLGRNVGFMEAELFDSRARLCAKASISAALVPGVINAPVPSKEVAAHA